MCLQNTAVNCGEMAERFNAAVLKTVEGATPPRVRISFSPPVKKAPLKRGVFLYCGGGLISGAGFCVGREYKIFLGELLDLWDGGFCYEGYPIVHCELGVNWSTIYHIEYIKDEKKCSSV